MADPEICHGKPTFKGTRIMAWQVLDDVGDGRSWDFICNHRSNACGGFAARRDNLIMGMRDRQNIKTERL